MSQLRGKKPEQVQKRIKMFVYGKAGIGKTIAALQFPNAYIVDMERGTENYAGLIDKAGSVVFSSNDPLEIRQEMETLLTVKHEFKTLVMDPVTVLYQGIQDVWSKKFAKQALASGKAKKLEAAEMGDFGFQYWGKVKRDYKAIQRLIMRLDMNVIITAHQKDVYGEGFAKLGVTYDSMKDDDYFFDYVFRLDKRGKEERVAITEKERAEIGSRKFPDEFVWSYENFLKFYGKEIIEKDAEVVSMATPQQVERIQQLVGIINIDDETIGKWFRKAGVDEWKEFTSEQIEKAISYCEEKAEGLRPPVEDDVPELPLTNPTPPPKKKKGDDTPSLNGRTEKAKAVVDRLALLKVEPKHHTAMVKKIGSWFGFDTKKQLKVNELETIHGFLYQVKMGAEKESDIFNSLWNEVKEGK